MERLQLILSKFENAPQNLAPAQPDIAQLFANFHCDSIVTDFYDSEPELPVDWETCWNSPEFLELWHKLCEEYEPERLQKLTWEELFQDGVWGMTQDYVNAQGRELLERFCGTDRLYYAEVDGGLFFYCFARDLIEDKCDYRIYMVPNS